MFAIYLHHYLIYFKSAYLKKAHKFILKENLYLFWKWEANIYYHLQ